MKNPHFTLTAVLASALMLHGCSSGNRPAVVEPVDPFAPSATDVADPDGHYAYPLASSPVTDPSLVNVRITYVTTQITAPKAGSGYYVLDPDTSTYVCQEYDASLTYPITLTLEDVNRDIDDTDICEPEINVNFQADGYPVTTAYNAKMRMRGSSTRLAQQKSYRVKLRSTSPCSTSTTYPCWRNDEITLQFNKHPYDLTRVRNKLAFDLMRDIPYLNSLRTQFAHITYNDGTADADLGLFTHVEKMGKEYLGNRGYNVSSNIYKANEFNFNSDDKLVLDGSTPGPDFEDILEIENTSGDHSAVVAMVNALNDYDADFDTTFNRYFNRNNYLAWLATNILMGNHDTRSQNFALYQPAGGERFYFLPWDYDGALGYENQPDVLAEGRTYDYTLLGLSNWWDSPLHRRFLQQPGNIQLVIAAVEDIRSKYLTAANISSKTSAYKPWVESLIKQNPDLARLPTDSGSALSNAEQWDAEYNRLPDVIEDNYQRFISGLEKPMPFWLSACTSGGQLVLDWGWPLPFDIQGGALKYTVKVATTPDFLPGTLVYGPTVINSATSVSIAQPASGTYYLQVMAADRNGHTTRGFNHVDIGDQRYFGVMDFTLTPCP